MCDEVIDNHSYTILSTDMLENDSYTISWSLTENPETEGWVFFHDYIPDYSISLRNQQLLQFYNDRLYEMNTGPKGTYFGITYPTIITPVFVSPYRDTQRIFPFVIRHFSWNCDIEDSLRRLLNETWTSISLHNSFQGTRQIPLTVLDQDCDILDQYGIANVRRVKNQWHYNYAFNEKTSEFQRTWIELIDKFLVINVNEKDCNKPEDRARMFDDFVIVRLLFDNNQSKRLFQYDINLTLSPATQ
jgi:hypothetical protein